MLQAFIMVFLAFSSGWQSGILKITVLFLFWIRLSVSEDTESVSRLAPRKSARERFEDDSVKWESRDALAITAFAVASWVEVLISASKSL